MHRAFSSRAILGAACFLFAMPAYADAAADKATAREVATEGIGLYKDGKYADALDRLKRAQALYDAPVHLLYIARAEDKLGQLVEAAETYRSLDHVALPQGAPDAWTSAVDDGRKELTVLEPRVPKLRIQVTPNDPTEADVQIDGAPVSAAVLGIDRPVNPGTHHVAVSAKGFAASEADVEVKEGETKDVPITLVPGTAPAAPSTTASAASTEKELSFVGFLAGLRLGVGIPTGKLFVFHNGNIATELNASDGFKPGGALELHAGIRIGKYFTPVLFVEGETLSPGSGFLGLRKIDKASASSIGLGVLLGTPPGKLGGFGEFDLVFVNQFSLTVEEGVTSKKCDLSARGAALRLGGGAAFPLARWFHLTPFAMATLGRFTSVDSGSGCTVVPKHDIEAGDQRTHGMIFLGVGGDLVLGTRGR